MSKVTDVEVSAFSECFLLSMKISCAFQNCHRHAEWNRILCVHKYGISCFKALFERLCYTILKTIIYYLHTVKIDLIARPIAAEWTQKVGIEPLNTSPTSYPKDDLAWLIRFMLELCSRLAGSYIGWRRCRLKTKIHSLFHQRSYESTVVKQK